MTDSIILACATMNPVNPDVREATASRERLHAIVAKATDGSRRPLWRLDDDRLYVMADQIDTDRLGARLGNAVIRTLDYGKHVDKILTPGATIRFTIEAAPSRVETLEGRKTRRAIRDPRQQLEWLRRKISEVGATVTEAYVTGHNAIQFAKTTSREKVQFGATSFVGTLTVNNPATLHDTITNGLGREKAYGMGMVMLF